MIIVQAIDLQFLIEHFRGISSLCIIMTKISIWEFLQVNLESVWWCLFIHRWFPKTIKPNVFRIPFRDQTSMTGMPLFKNMLQTVCLYLSMWVQLKWVGYDKLLESVKCLMDIRSIANVYYYLYMVIWMLLFLTHIWNIWLNSY